MPGLPGALDIRRFQPLEVGSQHGVFVYCPYDNLDGPYPLDRIVFPYRSPSSVLRGLIYPDQRSPLESLLDYYFQQEAIIAGDRVLKAHLKAAGVEFQLTVEGKDYLPKLFNGPFEPDPSWHLLSSWTVVGREHWNTEEPLELQLDVIPGSSEFAPNLHSRVEEGLKADQAKMRVVWAPRVVHTDIASLSPELGHRVQRAWNGMSRLPYTAYEISDAVRAMVALWMDSTWIHR